MSVQRKSAWLVLQHPFFSVYPMVWVLLLPCSCFLPILQCWAHLHTSQCWLTKGVGLCEGWHWGVHHLPVQTWVATWGQTWSTTKFSSQKHRPVLVAWPEKGSLSSSCSCCFSSWYWMNRQMYVIMLRILLLAVAFDSGDVGGWGGLESAETLSPHLSSGRS